MTATVSSAADPRLPSLSELGTDLLIVTPTQRRIALARPFIGVALYVVAWLLGLWWLTPLIVFLTFVAVVTVAHDVVHGTLGLTRRQTDWALFFTGAVLFESGHAYRITHLQHHRVFPGENDPEGYPAHIPLLAAIFYGPVFLARLWWWAFQRQTHRPRQRVWLIAEAITPGLAVTLGILLWPVAPGVLAYVVMAVVGSWVYPLLTVHLPHRKYGNTPLTQTHTLRGRIIPALFLELTYHLEHHLYPQVPSHHLKELARRLDPFFDQVGVKRRRVP